MVGQQQLIIDWRTWLKGMSSSSEIDDGGFSPESDGFNLIGKPGVLYGPSAEVDADTDLRLTGEIIASCPDMVGTSATERLLLTDDGSAHSYNGTKIAQVAQAIGGTNTWAKFFSDLIIFAGEAYATSKQNIVRWQSTFTFNNAFFAFDTTYGNVIPHPMIVFENNLFIASKDSNGAAILLRMTAAAGTPATILTLTAEQVITALGIDAGTGRMLIATTNTLNINLTLPGINKLHWYDGFSNKTLKTVIIEAPITGFHSHGGEIFVGYGGNKIGRINGSGIEFMRTLLDVFLDSDYLPTKHSFASIGETMYVLDGKWILAYGEVIKGAGKIWYYCGRNKINTNRIRALFHAGLGKLGLSFDTTKLYILAVSSLTASVLEIAPTTVDAFKLYTNNIDFPRPIYPRSLQLEFVESFTQNAGGTTLTVSYYDNYSPSGITTVGTLVRRNRPLSSPVQDEIVGFISNRKTTMLKFFISHTAVKGLRRIILFYDFAE